MMIHPHRGARRVSTPSVTSVHPTCRTLDEFTAWMDRTPDSAVKMCHTQGKTAVYRTDDGKWLVEQAPHGPITLQPFGSDPALDG